MFTGIVEEVGIIRAAVMQAGGGILEIGATRMLEDLSEGESVAVDGVCLTVTSISSSAFSVDVSPETMRTTTLTQRRPGDPVNLERALRLGDRMGGHQVTGHVDGVGKIRRLEEEGNGRRCSIEALPELMRYIVSRGSIAVDGISLTVLECDATGFTVFLIPFTLRETTIGLKRVGDAVNLECDLVAKYVEKAVGARQSAEAQSGKLDMDFLAEHGFV